MVDRDRGAAGRSALRLRGRRRAGRRQPRAGARGHVRRRSPTGCASCRRGSRSRCPSSSAPHDAEVDRVTDVVDLGPLIAGGGLTGPPTRPCRRRWPASHPIVLLPVRLETRYADAAGWRPGVARADLARPGARRRPRPAPDGSRGRGRAPVLAGRLAQRRRPGAAPARLAGAGRALRPGAGRPGSHVRPGPRTPPTRPTDAVADTDPPRVLPTFGTVQLTERPSTPVARLLPAAWTATAYAGGQVVAVATGRPITGDPAVGPDIDAPLVHPDRRRRRGRRGGRRRHRACTGSSTSTPPRTSAWRSGCRWTGPSTCCW